MYKDCLGLQDGSVIQRHFSRTWLQLELALSIAPLNTTNENRATATPNPLAAAFYRGGTSNALMIHKSHLPTDQSEWEPILAGALGSPDPYGRQLNGMGGGFSSLSKACVISPSERPDGDVEYTFVQMGIKTGEMDLSGTCGNMTSAVEPFAVDEGLVVPQVVDEDGDGRATVRNFNTNTNKIIHCNIAIDRDTGRFKTTGLYSIDGVPGYGSRISLHFLHSGDAKSGRTLPTGNPLDRFVLLGADGSLRGSLPRLRTTLLDVANPAVILDGQQLNVSPEATHDDLDSNYNLLAILELARKKGARMMGLDPTIESIPKLVMVFPPYSNSNVNLVARVLSMGQAHRAIPLTIALDLGMACQLPGTLPHSMVKGDISDGRVVIGHPSGKIEVGATRRDGDVEAAILHRTARVLMKGEVYWR